MFIRCARFSLTIASVAIIGPDGRVNNSQAAALASLGIPPRRPRRNPRSPRRSRGASASRPRRWDGVRLSSDGNFYDDFQDFDDIGSDGGGSVGGGGGVDLSSLRSRVSQVKGAESAYDAKLALNWRRGNWSVRGFALEGRSCSSSAGPASDAAGEDTVDVSVVAAPSSASFTDSSVPQDRALPRDRSVAVGRTDGSVFVVRLGDQYFSRMPVEQRQVDREMDGDGGAGMFVRTQNEWIDSNDKRDQHQDEQTRASQSRASGKGDQADREPVPFEIICQFLTANGHGEPVNSLVYHDTNILEEEACGGIICAGAGNSGDISVLKLPCSGNEGQVIHALALGGVHGDRIVALEVMVLRLHQDDAEERNILFSASCDGTFALWDLGRDGELIISCRCPDGASLTCADVSNPTFSIDGYVDGNGEDIVLLGTSDGYVFGYYVRELLFSAASGDPRSEFAAPNLRFRAHGLDSGIGEAVTAIECGGDGTIPSSARLRSSTGEGPPSSGGLGDNPGISSFILLTGGEDGSVKQWEILSQKSSSQGPAARMEHWPRISSQRMRRRSHLFPPGHDGPVMSISQQGRIDTSKFLTCGRDGSLRVWSASSGEQLYAMDGFSSGISSLACLGRDLLVTDGMGGYVCVHDFGIEEDAVSGGYDLEW